MYAIKGNRQYAVGADGEVDSYVSRGYDVFDDDGKPRKLAKGKTVPYETYKDALDRLEAAEQALKAAGIEPPGPPETKPARGRRS